LKIGEYDGIITVSGDGLIHEVVNGLYRRKDWMQIMSTLTLGFIPGGSANGLVANILELSGYDVTV
jgi:sphingosine kinase